MNRKYSLKKNHDIERLIKNKQSVGNKYYAIYYQYSEEKLPKVAISPSKKFKTAVRRNYEKRVVKEIIREQLGKLNNLQLLIIVKTKVDELDFEGRKKQIVHLTNKVLRSKHEKTD